MSEKAPMQSTPFVSSTGETRNPIYEGQFDGETLEQAEARRHWAKVAMEMARNAALSAPSHGEQVRQMVPEPVRDALARRCLWLAFCWNDHNFGPAHEESRKEALKHGIDSFDAANEWLAAAPSAGSQE